MQLKNYVYFAGTDGGAAAICSRERETTKGKFNQRRKGDIERFTCGGNTYPVRNASWHTGRTNADQPANLQTEDPVFAVIAITPTHHHKRRQITER